MALQVMGTKGWSADPAEPVDGLGNQFLAGAGFAVDKDIGRCWGNASV